jgi:glycosyltransferase involved in cell wall biosynthesis
MKINPFKKEVNCELAIIDPTFPQKNPKGFRNIEINELLKKVKKSASFTMYPMKPDPQAWFSHGYGMIKKEFKENKKKYLKKYPENKKKIFLLKKNEKYNFKLAYSFFLAETFTLLRFYEKNKIPFVFTLYPGGAFGLNFKKSDKMLEKVFQSKYFKGVIVTQKITEKYLLEKNLCPVKKMFYIEGGWVQFKKNEIFKKKLYKKNKNTFDICFVAYKYSNKGVDKGYDLFIKTAKILCKKTKNIMFHVIGNFNPEDINITKIKKRIKFYGLKEPIFLRKFYKNMDILLSPNRPFKLFKGNFDGFPLGIDSLFCGVCGFVSDELKMNTCFTNKKNIILIPLEPELISNKIMFYYKNLNKLYNISKEGQKLTQRIYDPKYQTKKRLEFLKKIL